MEMLRNFRLKKAAELLISHPELSIQDVTSKVGFKERTHFNAIFQKKYNMSPSEWRKRNGTLH
jgi:two-component system response regulator YesN